MNKCRDDNTSILTCSRVKCRLLFFFLASASSWNKTIITLFNLWLQNSENSKKKQYHPPETHLIREIKNRRLRNPQCSYSPSNLSFSSTKPLMFLLLFLLLLLLRKESGWKQVVVEGEKNQRSMGSGFGEVWRSEGGRTENEGWGWDALTWTPNW